MGKAAIIGGLIGVLAILAVLLFLPTYVVEYDLGFRAKQLDPSELAKAKNDVRATLLQAVGGIVLITGAVATWRQLKIAREQMRNSHEHTEQQLQLAREQIRQNQELTQRQIKASEEGQITERFTRAIEQLGDNKVDVRLGGIYSLERIARDSRADRAPIVEVLTAYIRNHAPYVRKEAETQAVPTTEEEPEEHDRLVYRAPDIQAAMTVLGRRSVGKGERLELYFGRVNLFFADLFGANLAGSDFTDANLQHSFLREVDLSNSHLAFATFRHASLYKATIRHCTIHDGDFINAFLVEADFEGSFLQRAKFNGADLSKASLRETYLHAAQLAGAILDDTDLTGARADSNTSWPENFDPESAGIIIGEEFD